jgi:SAM-dependent methyltransferase
LDEGRYVATHQEIANVTDQELVDRMVSSHGDRFDDVFWEYFERRVHSSLSASPTIIDIGCGPGLFLKDLRERYPGFTLIGTDVTEAMIDYARETAFEGDPPELHVHDITSEPLPVADNSVEFVSMVAVLHVLNDPIKVLEEISRVLTEDGTFLLQDWIRTPLPVYLKRMMPEGLTEEQQEKAKRRMLALFTVHNKFAKDDWLWLLREAGMEVQHRQELRSPHFCTFICRRARS